MITNRAYRGSAEPPHTRMQQTPLYSQQRLANAQSCKHDRQTYEHRTNSPRQRTLRTKQTQCSLNIRILRSPPCCNLCSEICWTSRLLWDPCSKVAGRFGYYATSVPTALCPAANTIISSLQQTRVRRPRSCYTVYYLVDIDSYHCPETDPNP